MKMLLIKFKLLLAVLLYAIQVSAQTTNGLVYYLPFNEGSGDPVDQSPLNKGPANMGSQGIWTEGVIDHAVNITPKTSSTVSFSESYICRTVAFWFKPDQIINDNLSEDQYMFQLEYSDLIVKFITSGHLQVVSQGSYILSSQDTQWDAAIWYFIAFTTDQVGGAKLYINGVIQDSNTNATNDIRSSSSDDSKIGGRKNISSNKFDGVIDEFRIYDRGLAEFEVQELYNVVTPGVPSQSLGVVWSKNSDGNIYYENDSVGIGNTAPSYKLDVTGSLNATEIYINGQALGADEPWTINSTDVFTTSGNVGVGTETPAYLLHLKSSDPGIAFENNAFSKWHTKVDASGQFVIQDAINSTDPIKIENGSPSACIHVKSNGQVGIGTDNPQSKLSVKGIVTSKEVNITDVGWSDFVFRENYALKPLEEVEDYIRQNHHLPDIPSAEEVAENGIKLGEMDAKLLQKVEELTLYLIEMKKENQEIKAINQNLLERIEKLEK